MGSTNHLLLFFALSKNARSLTFYSLIPYTLQNLNPDISFQIILYGLCQSPYTFTHSLKGPITHLIPHPLYFLKGHLTPNTWTNTLHFSLYSLEGPITHIVLLPHPSYSPKPYTWYFLPDTFLWVVNLWRTQSHTSSLILSEGLPNTWQLLPYIFF